MDSGKDEKITKRIMVSGIVQGVGFRPLVYHIAKKNAVKGTVRNTGGMVEITVSCGEEVFLKFLKDLKGHDSGNHEIQKMQVFDSEFQEFLDFRIIESKEDGGISIIPPDLPVCEHCENELKRETDRRFGNPFINCMNCGPRYSMINTLPYDRDHTAMGDFEMCPRCQEEYRNPTNRRFHAQGISCNDCGPTLLFKELGAGHERQGNEECIRRASELLKEGGIIAVKGIGGYHLACSPFMEKSVLTLRKLKGREKKPFAILFDSVDTVNEFCHLSKEEKKLLMSKERPIVLLQKKEKELAASVGKGSMYLGTFLPYTPLQIMLLKEFKILIMTSANISGSPIIKEDEEMLSLLSPYLKGVLYHKRKIIRSVDDSVAKIVDGSEVQLVRRSRGHVPYPIFLKGKKEEQIFAAGSDLKAAFCLYKEGRAVVSQYFGDLEEFSSFKRYKDSYTDLTRLLKIHPDTVACDLHPNFYSSKFAKSLGLRLTGVQHHHAHIASVMAEHHLEEKVIGVAFDGTGYGTDGKIWGGEFLLCQGGRFERAAHLAYNPVIGGDSSMKDAKKTADCFLINAGLRNAVNEEHKNIIEMAIKYKMNTILTSSMGRLFDAVSSILGFGDKNGYEGECAVNLEKEAVLAKSRGGIPEKLSFSFKEEDNMIIISTKPVLESIVGLREAADKALLALAFHYAVAQMVLRVCERIRAKENLAAVALSGGVFQNKLLLEETLRLLRENNFKVYINKAVPPNDGCISLGQTFISVQELR